MEQCRVGRPPRVNGDERLDQYVSRWRRSANGASSTIGESPSPGDGLDDKAKVSNLDQLFSCSWAIIM